MVNNNLKIGTHNSATGEEGTFWSCFLIPFAKCQSKTLAEQYKAGCRFFDIRVRELDGELYCYHGIWRSKNSAQKIIKDFIYVINEPVFIEITWEGSTINSEQYQKVYEFAKWVNSNVYIFVTRINIKEGWKCLYLFNNITYKGNGTGFIGINGWKCILPFPRLWSWVRGRVEFNKEEFILVDFL